MVGGDADIIQIGKEIRYHDSANRRHYRFVSPRNGLDNSFIDGVVEFIYAAVNWFQRVGRIIRMGRGTTCQSDGSEYDNSAYGVHCIFAAVNSPRLYECGAGLCKTSYKRWVG